MHLRGSALVLGLGGVLAVACVGPDEAREGDLEVATYALSPADPVSAAVTSTCTTAAVVALSTQLVDEIQCMRPGSMKSIEGAPGLVLGDAVFPFLQTPAADAVLAVQKARGVTMTINSALRTLPQQYLLYRWYKLGRCGIKLAAQPGRSNHESALAVDVEDANAWRPTMAAEKMVWLGSSDPVHFDFKGEGAVELRGVSVLAFQRLWNRNHPEDPIAEDGVYGPATEARLAKAPVGGFAKGPADCATADAPVPVPATPPPPVEVVAEANVDAPPEGQDGCAVVRSATSGLPDAGTASAALLGTVMLRILRRRARRSTAT